VSGLGLRVCGRPPLWISARSGSMKEARKEGFLVKIPRLGCTQLMEPVTEPRTHRNSDYAAVSLPAPGGGG
jgi:hypothetical protein